MMKSKFKSSKILILFTVMQLPLTFLWAQVNSIIPIPGDGRLQVSDPVPDSQISTLMNPDLRGGKLITLEEFDLSKPNARWDKCDTARMVYESIPGTPYGCYRLNSLVPKDKDGVWQPSWINSAGLYVSKPNRSYVVSALINCNFDRTADHRQEINIGAADFGQLDSPDNNGRGRDATFINGVPNQTGGWVRWEYECTSLPNSKTLQFLIEVHRFEQNSEKEQQFRIADLKIIELPQKTPVPFAKGAGVTFRGSVGNLPMEVSPAVVSSGTITIVTTGARYTFDLQKNTIKAEQLLERQRPIAIWKSSLPLGGLSVLKEDKSVCVLANNVMTLGIQADSMMMIAPQSELTLTCRSKIAGRWNRLYEGHLIAMDDFGGMTVNPVISPGAGDKGIVQCQPITPDLDFVGVANNTNFLSSVNPGWEIAWTTSPGQRLAMSVFPPRPFDWKESFDYRPLRITEKTTSMEYDYSIAGNFSVICPWEWSIQGYGMSFGPEYLPYDESAVRAHIAKIKSLPSHVPGVNIKPCQYTSPYFYYSRNPQEYANEVKRLRDDYGFEGVYMDFLPQYHAEWVIAYEEMRLVREIFPKGAITLHGSYGPPVGMSDIFIPFIETYATATLKGEDVRDNEVAGLSWSYPRYVTSQFSKSNCIGMTFGDHWDVIDPWQAEVSLCRGGRAFTDLARYKPAGKIAVGWLDVDECLKYYLPELTVLGELWKKSGSDPQFYQKFYLPEVLKITGDPFGGESYPLASEAEDSDAGPGE